METYLIIMSHEMYIKVSIHNNTWYTYIHINFDYNELLTTNLYHHYNFPIPNDSTTNNINSENCF